MDPAAVLDAVRRYPDWPRPGTTFCDVRGVLADGALFASVVEHLADAVADAAEGTPVDTVLGVETRGLALGAAVAHRIGAGFVPVARAGRLPPDVEHDEFALEYGSDLVAVPRAAVGDGRRVVIIDAVLATGATLAATARLVRRCGAEVVGVGVLVELVALGGRSHLPDLPLWAVAQED